MEKCMYNIAVIGVGAIGKRHLESLLNLDDSYRIYIVDRDQEMVCRARELNRERITGGTTAEILPSHIHVAIIATSSAVRREVFEQLLAHSSVDNILFEKVLFQRETDYAAVKRQLEEQKIRAWVNCSRREYDSYRSLKKMLEHTEFFTFSIEGGCWGLGCNGIHMLDLISYLSDCKSVKINNLNLLPLTEESKRKGYQEFYGSIVGECGKCRGYVISCHRNSGMPMVIDISGNDFRCSILEQRQTMYIMRKENNWAIEETQFVVPFQSQLTQKVIERIISTGDCSLTKYEESMELHLAFIKPLMSFFESRGFEPGVCPIT